MRHAVGRRVRPRLATGEAVLAAGLMPAWPETLLATHGRRLVLPHLRAFQHRASVPQRTVFLLDCSASMVASGALARAKALLLGWLRALRRCDAEAVVIAFGAGGASVRFGPAVPRGWNARWLAPLPGGGGTPLQRGVAVAQAYGRRGTPGRRALSKARAVLVLVTDGRTVEQPVRPDGFDTVDIVLPLGDRFQGDAGNPAATRPSATLQRIGRQQAERLASAWGATCRIQ